MINLKFCAMTATIFCNESRNPEEVMRELGISYQNSDPQPIYDRWIFYGCENIPKELPKYLTIIDPETNVIQMGNGEKQ